MNLTNHYPSLAGKLVLITGGATGIGAGLVEAFCVQGARVVFLDILEDEARRLVGKVTALDGATAPEFYYCDLADIPALKTVIATIEQRFGQVAVLINNAARDTRHDYSTVSEAYWVTC